MSEMRAYCITYSNRLQDGSPNRHVILADSWSQDGARGVLRFFDAKSRLIDAIAMEKVERMTMLVEGDLIWFDHAAVYPVVTPAVS